MGKILQFEPDENNIELIKIKIDSSDNIFQKKDPVR